MATFTTIEINGDLIDGVQFVPNFGMILQEIVANPSNTAYLLDMYGIHPRAFRVVNTSMHPAKE